MNPSRRSFLKAAAVLAPAVILTPGLLMKVRPLSGWTTGLHVFPNQYPMTATEVLRRRAEYGRMWQEIADRMVFPPLVLHADGSVSPMKLEFPRALLESMGRA